MADRFDTIRLGDEAEISRVITAQDVDAFVRLTGDTNPLHTDESFAAETNFKHRVVHGMLTASFISTVIGTKLPGEGALWFEQQTRFLAPVRIGEEVRVWVKVKHKSDAQRVVVLETVVFGEGGRRVIEGEARVKVLAREKKKATNMIEGQKGAVIISGASRGIGAAVARQLAARGHAVVINFQRSEEQAHDVAQEIVSLGGRAIFHQADISDRQAVDAMVARARAEFKGLDGAVNNASGVIEPKDFSALTWPEIEEHVNVQLKGAFNLTQTVLPDLLEQKHGVIVNISSIYADQPPPKLLPYSMVKAALVNFGKSLAVEFGPQGLRVNCVSPGMTSTDLISNVPEKIKVVTKMQTPLRRLAAPEDVAGVVAFLFSDDASFITGQNIRVSGGAIMS
jgi:3-oxoacyl-[acyl-carrier protein] reductase